MKTSYFCFLALRATVLALVEAVLVGVIAEQSIWLRRVKQEGDEVDAALPGGR